jgi:hypothetical protein
VSFVCVVFVDRALNGVKGFVNRDTKDKTERSKKRKGKQRMKNTWKKKEEMDKMRLNKEDKINNFKK